MNDLTREIITTETHLTMAAMQGNAGAGGVFLALAADMVYAAPSVILNPHYKNMGNLYGSEYWTYLLPRRVGWEQALAITQNRLPIETREAKREGLIDDSFGADRGEFIIELRRRAEALAASADYHKHLAAKCTRRAQDEAERPLERYREEEMARMHLNFYGFDPSYHVTRYNFVYRVPNSRTPFHLALHRSIDWRTRSHSQ